uniref:Uncharacterized protein MANES_14G117600 n=1 Tax=Rhizophora mucronata TaxID=61149 RepID=A0A2P2NCH3_RHIMU
MGTYVPRSPDRCAKTSRISASNPRVLQLMLILGDLFIV